MLKNLLSLESKYLANNYKSLPVMLTKGLGVDVWDVDGKKYMDFLSSYSANNHGHCHPVLVDTMQKQCSQLTLTSRAFHNDLLGKFGETITKKFGYEKVLPMNTGVEAGETAVKLARKWGYEKKNIDPNRAVVLFAENNFWGRTLAASSTQKDKDAYHNFGPFTPNLWVFPYNNLEILEQQFQNPNVCAYFFEPIQGEAGVIIPDDNYLSQVRKLCNKYNVLMIVDEVQTGMGRTGKLFCSESVKPDVLLLGKALSGGMMPVSAVLADDKVMDVITPGTHGSTFGGNPLGCAISIEAINLLENEKMIQNSVNMGAYIKKELLEITKNHHKIKDVRGQGLMMAIETIDKETTDYIIKQLSIKGILCKSTRENVIRLSPPLIITKDQIDLFLDRITKILIDIK